MDPRAHQCGRCGMAVPADADRCPSCRSRRARRHVAVPATLNRVGPLAAEAWQHHAALPPRPTEEVPLGDVHSAWPVAPGAVAASTMLRLAVLAGFVVAGVQAGRLAMAAAVADGARLTTNSSWDTLGVAAEVGVAVAAAAAMAATVLVIGWAAAAGHNVRALRIDARRWVHGATQVATQVGLLVVVAVAWRWAPGAPDRVDRCIDLALGLATAGALVSAAGATRRFLVAVTTRELEQAALLVRIEQASAERRQPRHREPAPDWTAGTS